MEEDFLQLLLLKVIVSRLDSDRLKNLKCTLVCTNFLLLLQTREDQKTLFMRSRVNFLHVGIQFDGPRREIYLEKQQFKMLVVFSAIFMADTKIIFRYDFVAPLMGTYRSNIALFKSGNCNKMIFFQFDIYSKDFQVGR